MNKLIKNFCLLLFISISSINYSSCDKDDENGGKAINSIPNELTYYSIDIEGTTWSNFSRTGCLYVMESVETAANFNNGVNEREIGIVSGFPAGNPEVGAMWFFTNSSLCQYGATGCNSTVINAALDIAFVTVNENNRTIKIQLDGQLYNNTAAGAILTSNFLNHFTANSGLFATVYRSVTGTINIEFSEDGKNISGTIDITGNNFSGTGTGPYSASFTGEEISISAASCR